MIKVLHYAPGFRSGGIESRLLDWYRNIDRNKVTFILVKLNNDEDTPNLLEFKQLGGVFYNLPPFNIKSFKLFKIKIREILTKEKIDVVHVHDLNTGYFVLREASRLNIPCRILHSRTTAHLPNERNVFIKNYLKKNAYKYANHYFACSYEAGLWGIGEHKDVKIKVIKNGIQVENYKFNKEIREKIRRKYGISEKIVIGCVCRLSEQKNLPFLLSVFEDISNEDNRYVLMIVGEGNNRLVTDYLDKHNVKGEVILTGMQKNVWDYYMAFDIFCGTSLYEGFGTTAIEAQASGLPTLLSFGFPKVVEITPFLHRLKTDNTENWVKLIKEYEGKRFSEEGMHDVIESGYSASSVAKGLEQFYERNINKEQ